MKQKSTSPSKFRTTIADKSEILQQLISPGLERQASFNDEINLVDKLSTNNIGPDDIVLPQSNISQETSFSNDCSIGDDERPLEFSSTAFDCFELQTKPSKRSRKKSRSPD